MSKKIELKISGIRCDAPKCTYAETDPVGFEAVAAYLNKPCPLCGAPLLTEADYGTMLMLYGFSMSSGDASDDAERVTVPLIMDGTGAVEIGEVQA